MASKDGGFHINTCLVEKSILLGYLLLHLNTYTCTSRNISLFFPQQFGLNILHVISTLEIVLNELATPKFFYGINGDNLHEMSNPVFLENKKNIVSLSYC